MVFIVNLATVLSEYDIQNLFTIIEKNAALFHYLGTKGDSHTVCIIVLRLWYSQ